MIRKLASGEFRLFAQEGPQDRQTAKSWYVQDS